MVERGGCDHPGSPGVTRDQRFFFAFCLFLLKAVFLPEMLTSSGVGERAGEPSTVT